MHPIFQIFPFRQCQRFDLKSDPSQRFLMRWQRWLQMVSLIILVLGISIQPAWARIDPYVAQYLNARDAIELPLNDTGEQITVTPEQLSEGKQLFQSACINCHVAGATLPNPTVSLSLADLQGATPPRDNLTSLMAFQREPMNYDNSDLSYECRRVSPAWMSDQDLQNLAAFILRAADVAPGWGPNILRETANRLNR